MQFGRGSLATVLRGSVHLSRFGRHVNTANSPSSGPQPDQFRWESGSRCGDIGDRPLLCFGLGLLTRGDDALVGGMKASLAQDPFWAKSGRTTRQQLYSTLMAQICRHDGPHVSRTHPAIFRRSV